MLGLLLKHRGEDCGIADGEKAPAVDTRRKITDRGIIVALVMINSSVGMGKCRGIVCIAMTSTL